MKATYDMMPDYEPSKFFNSYLAAIYIKKTKLLIWVYFERMYYFP